MNAPFNFDRLFGPPQEKVEGNKNMFKKAALLYEFEPKEDFKGFSSDEVGVLISKSSARMNGKYVLQEDVLRKVITDDIGVNNIEQEIVSNNVNSEFSNALLKTIQKDDIDYHALSDTELFYSSKLTWLMPQKLDENVIKSEIRLRQFFSPIEKIIQNFAGREKELDQIRQFVYAQPSLDSGLLSSYGPRQPLLIQGIGGVGKSTLMSKFIFDHNIVLENNKLPFVVIDFDLPGFSIKEPMNILLEALRQLNIQFPAFEAVFQEVIQTVSHLTFSEDSDTREFYKSSNISQRGVAYGKIDSLMDSYGYNLNQINLPVLIVFDSFEEMQYRASRGEIDNFFRFIWEILTAVPFLRCAFVGRSEISETLGDFRFTKIELREFDEESATAFLKKNKLNDNDLCKAIYNALGGNPLILRLAADLVRKDPKVVKDFDKIKNKKHEFLVDRIIDHIHDPEIQKIAVPGMLIRRINPEVIKMVLAEPCHLSSLTDEEANQLFDKLRQEVALISRYSDTNEFAFRQDLRMACEEMIREKYHEESESIDENAIRFYQANISRGVKFEGEYYYHLLKKGENLELLDKATYERIRAELEPAIIELPQKAQLYISSLQSTRSSQELLGQASLQEWENYYLAQIKDGLNYEFQYVQKLFQEVTNRTERSSSPNSEFPFFEALLYQRTNHLLLSSKVIERALNQQPANKYIDELKIIQVQNLEYEGKYPEALALCETINPKSGNNLCKREFLYARLQMRVNGVEYERTRAGLSFTPDFKDAFVDTYWNMIFRGSSKASFQKSGDYEEVIGKLSNSVKGLQALEKICYDQLDMYLKDISLAGTFDILLHDMLQMIEAKGRTYRFF